MSVTEPAEQLLQQVCPLDAVCANKHLDADAPIVAKFDFPPLARNGNLNHNGTLGGITECVMDVGVLQAFQKIP